MSPFETPREPVTTDLGIPKKVHYVRCECGFKHENGQNCYSHIHAGHYCPECGSELTEYNELRRITTRRIRRGEKPV